MKVKKYLKRGVWNYKFKETLKLYGCQKRKKHIKAMGIAEFIFQFDMWNRKLKMLHDYEDHL